MKRFPVPALCILFSTITFGCGTPSFLITPVSSSQALHEEIVEEGKGFGSAKIVIIEIEGMLSNYRDGGLLQAGENKLSLFTQQLEKAEKDDSVKAIVLRINSPGGTVTTICPSASVGTSILAPSTASDGVMGTSTKRFDPSRRK